MYRTIALILLLLHGSLLSSQEALPLRLNFVGDIMAHESNYQMQDFSRIYRGVKPLLDNLKSALNFANLEFVIDEQRPYSSYPTFNVHTEYVQAAADAGFNVFSLANNHTADFGLAGIRATEQSVRALCQELPGLHFSGLRAAGQNPDSFLMESIEQRGWRLGFTAISILTNRSEGIEAVQYIRAGDSERLQQFYRWLSGQRAVYDLLVVSVHGGKEYQPEPSAQKRKIIREIGRSGADIVWGHHPHVQQPWEIFEHKADPKRSWSLLMYSQGNFISAQTIRTKAHESEGFWAATGDSVLLKVELGRTRTGTLELRRLQPLLLTTIRLKPWAFAVVPMQDAAAVMRQQGYQGWEAFYERRRNWLEQRVAQWPVKG